ncbi:MFS transporter [Desulfopila sp. IMCC35006]|uniref:MFS transporter n=1 Tax=Desulfopila sp. IMCC35006 TaxID=2569542 RepID=UPI0010ABB332|nr:MFS transporter [Desulfopila sp. IMCC35006]TKB23725.1 MFS transporter [Desulfopila sp. IMCC35006]
MDTSPKDIVLLFSARIVRLFAYGFISVILALYLAATGLYPAEVGAILSATLIGDIVVSLWVTMVADRMGRRRMLLLGTLLMMLAGIVFLLTTNPLLITIAAIIGIVSPSGGEIGPFISIEQAALSQLIPDNKRTKLFGWYNLAGSFATAAGALTGGWLARLLQNSGFERLESYQWIMAGYAVCGLLLMLLFFHLSRKIELPMTTAKTASSAKTVIGLHGSRKTIFKLSGLFALDAFGGGFVVQSMIAWWLHIRFGIDEGGLGALFFGANLFAGMSALLATRLADRIGLIAAMVYTHIPSNIMLCLVPLMPNLWAAVGMLLLRASISQMDVPVRQSYTMAVVAPDERSAASGITTVARSVGAAASPLIAGLLMANPLFFSAPFFIAGGLKITYDLLLYSMFENRKS